MSYARSPQWRIASGGPSGAARTSARTALRTRAESRWPASQKARSFNGGPAAICAGDRFARKEKTEERRISLLGDSSPRGASRLLILGGASHSTRYAYVAPGARPRRVATWTWRVTRSGPPSTNAVVAAGARRGAAGGGDAPRAGVGSHQVATDLAHEPSVCHATTISSSASPRARWTPWGSRAPTGVDDAPRRRSAASARRARTAIAARGEECLGASEKTPFQSWRNDDAGKWRVGAQFGSSAAEEYRALAWPPRARTLRGLSTRAATPCRSRSESAPGARLPPAGPPRFPPRPRAFAAVARARLGRLAQI